MKQLITVNDENVLRFRHECFLMKNLSHPNVVKLVGVAWSENLMACCLEFAESGSLEHWLRLTAGGKKWAKEDVVDRSKEDEKRALIKASLEAKVFFGWNSENVDHSSRITAEDAAHAESTMQTIQKLAATCSSAEFMKSWKPVLQPDGSSLAYGARSFSRYQDKYGER
jgi:hypothetical protein